MYPGLPPSHKNSLLTCDTCWLDRALPSTRERNLLLCSQIASSSAKHATSLIPCSLSFCDLDRALFIWSTWVSSTWGRVRMEQSDIHRPWTHIWTRCMILRVVANQPSLAAMSTRAWRTKWNGIRRLVTLHVVCVHVCESVVSLPS